MILEQEILQVKLKLTKEILPFQEIERLFRLISLLQRSKVDLKAVESFAMEGFPFLANPIRRICWVIQLKILSNQRSQWASQIQHLHTLYSQLTDLYFQPEVGFPKKHSSKDEDWISHKDDYLLWEDIEKDVLRTHSDKSFFNSDSKYACPLYLTNARKQKLKLLREDYQQQMDSIECTKLREGYMFDHMSKMLFIWAKMNPTVRYVQGLNQIIAQLFYLFNYDNKQTPPDQPMVFFVFNAIVNTFVEMLIGQFDHSDNGLHGRLSSLNIKISRTMPLLGQHLKKLNILPQYYALKWLTMLFAQNFQIFDVLRLWDSLIFSNNLNQYADCLCLAVLDLKQKKLLQMEFNQALKTIQRVDDLSVDSILEKANQLFKRAEPYQGKLIVF